MEITEVCFEIEKIWKFIMYGLVDGGRTDNDDSEWL